jgi:hypothetical protein
LRPRSFSSDDVRLALPGNRARVIDTTDGRELFDVPGTAGAFVEAVSFSVREWKSRKMRA